MRGVLPICFLLFISLVSCVKQPNEDPVPTLEYQEMINMRRVVSESLPARDTAVLVLNYSDGDGDLFRDNNSDGPNLIYSTYAFDPDSLKFILDQGPSPYTVTQPANGYYKGKAIHGEIFLPLKNFRSSTKIKVIRFETFIVDMKGNKSNVVVTPSFSLSF